MCWRRLVGKRRERARMIFGADKRVTET